MAAAARACCFWLVLLGLSTLVSAAPPSPKEALRTWKRLTPLGSTPCFDVPPEHRAALGASTVCVPRLYIAGNPKSGSSALWWYARKHPNISGRFAPKEGCPSTTDWTWIRKYGSLPCPEHLISGCFLMQSIADLVGHLPDVRVVTLYRDFPHWIFASYLYWCFLDLEPNCPPITQWSNPSHYRSPEHFHAIVEAGPRIVYKHGIRALMMNAATVFADSYNRSLALFGPERFLAVRTEDLHADTARVLREIFAFWGVPAVELPPQVLNSSVNTYGSKGIDVNAPKSDALGGSAPFAMLRKTENLLRRMWHKDCQFMRRVARLQWNCASELVDPPERDAVQVVLNSATLFRQCDCPMSMYVGIALLPVALALWMWLRR